MDDPLIERLEQLLLSEGGFLISVRTGKDVDSQVVQDIVAVIDTLAINNSRATLIPRRLAALLYDYCDSVHTCILNYSRTEQIILYEYTDKITASVLSCLYGRPLIDH